MLANLDDNHLPKLGGNAINALKHALFYNQKCLQANATPDDFFKEISHKIDLEGKILSPFYILN